MTTSQGTIASKATFSPPATSTVPRSPWHSPVPYLFGGLAAMLGLIAFALLILACSYWKLSGQMNNGEEDGERDVENGDGNNATVAKSFPVFEEKIVVIMAGDVKPTFLATPMSSRASSFGDANGKNEQNEKEKEDMNEKAKQENEESSEVSTTHLSQEQENQ